jgi:putative SOS response-associated peptidase YedK
MCNLYNIAPNQEAIRRFIGIMEDRVGNLEPSLDLYPDRPAPVVRNLGNGVRELAKLTWGMPTPDMLLKPGAPDTGVTNVRKALAAALAAMARCRAPLCRAGNRLL